MRVMEKNCSIGKNKAEYIATLVACGRTDKAGGRVALHATEKD